MKFYIKIITSTVLIFKGDTIMRYSAVAASLLSIAGLCSLHQSAHAHGAWLAKIHGDYHVMWGHDPSNTGPYSPAEVTEARGVKNSEVRALPVVRTEKYASIDATDVGIVSAIMSGGFRTQTSDGKYHSLTKAEAKKLGEVKSSAYRTRYMVTYANDREQPKLLGYDLELLPQINPAKAKKGDVIPVQVLLKGQPVANATINDNFLAYPRQHIKTDAQGRANMTVANYGHNAWAVSHSVPYPDLQKADTAAWSTVMTFSVPGPAQAE
ncbi:MAG: DUF4198 domain-containing protein [Brachymonas sp.]|nr:DUF4198 domain-containing protein [Brachymonas sp.]